MRALALLAAAAMVVSLFLPWLNVGELGTGFVPWDLVKNLSPDAETVQRFATDSPAEVLVFLATFVLAALFVLLSLLGMPSRLLAVVAGGGAVGLVGYTYWQIRDGAMNLGVPAPSGDTLQSIGEQLSGILGMGAWAWGVGATILLLGGLIGFGRRA